MPRLCAFGCKPHDLWDVFLHQNAGGKLVLFTDVPTHRFPNPEKFPEQFKAWVGVLRGQTAFTSSDVDVEYYKKKIICDIHFTERDKNRNKRLNRLAVPTLNLPGQLSNSRPNQQEQEEATVARLHATSQPANTGQLSNSRPNQQEQEEATVARLHATSQPANTDQLSNSRPNQQEQEDETRRRLHATSQPANTDSFQDVAGVTSRVTMEHNYASRPKGTAKKVAKKIKTGVVHPLRTEIRRLRTAISRWRKKAPRSFEARLENATNLSYNVAFQQVVKNMSTPARLFLQMQKQASKKAKGRRFHIEEKVLSLSLFKRSPKCYALLCKYFTLPSVKAMKRLLSQIKLCPGINPIIFKKIKETVRKSNIPDRVCSLIFDEMSLTPQIFYNAQKDSLEGFSTVNDTQIADHALVFMIKGIKSNFKQPIAYYFTTGLKKVELKKLITTVVNYAQKAGLIVINTVCDQSAVNVGAISELVSESKAEYLRLEKEWRHDVITVNGKTIIPIYDAPHLIKGIRNNLLTKDMVYTTNNVEKIVKWEYFEMVYSADKSYSELRLLDKLTEEHVNPQKINKMRVKSATQLFSKSVAATTDHLVARGDLPVQCRQLIDITLLLDQLFDSLNVSTFNSSAKKYKQAVKQNSPHHELWRESKAVLRTVKFRKQVISGNKVRIVETTVPSVVNLIKTIEGMEEIWKVVSGKYEFDALFTRNLNQDPAENFFGNIRSFGARNNSPNTVAFEGSFKALLLNNFSTPHSTKANCEEDSNRCLQTLHFFLKEKYDASDVPNKDNIECNAEVFNCSDLQETDAGQRNYVCGWVLRKCLKSVVKGCKTCRQKIIDADDKNVKNSFIKAKEYNNKKKWLCYPSEEFENCFHDIQNVTTSFLKRNVPKKNLKKNISLVTDVLVDFPFNCATHKEVLKTYFISVTINVLLYSWCRSINRILAGKLTYDGDDEYKMSAQIYYNKHKHYKNKK